MHHVPPRRREAGAPRPRDAVATRRAIVDAAIAEFAEKGLAGARVDEIAARTATTKAMIYYYFGSKQALWVAAIEEAYGAIRDAEAALDLDALPAAEALTRLVEATFDVHAAHPEYVRLISVENIHRARHVPGSDAIARRNAAVIQTVSRLLARGVAEGAFRDGVDPLRLHLMINAFCFYRVSNRHTLAAIFGRDGSDDAVAAADRAALVDAAHRLLAPGTQIPLAPVTDQPVGRQRRRG